MTILIMTLLVMTLLGFLIMTMRITLNTGDNTYNDIITDFTYK